MKKLACLMVVAVLLAVSMIPCFAASGINDCEQKIITYVKTAYVVDGKTITVPAEYITALENVFTKVTLQRASTMKSRLSLMKLLLTVKQTTLQSSKTSQLRMQQLPLSVTLTVLWV